MLWIYIIIVIVIVSPSLHKMMSSPHIGRARPARTGVRRLWSYQFVFFRARRLLNIHMSVWRMKKCIGIVLVIYEPTLLFEYRWRG
ncbi:hypothetical protein BU24DRAFT_281627 [Aaosphaeria arxii CBS 175.79]|uniref:Secreted protein n=1 Tax=Aaosphaeria arxii CBS 175.79 TaxID=1450172 RepID=A0A6A5XF72_9PLEO|nr:uncharacterized protein BU24DRAFT_281627 [Aaosphaeria arxii CBS 175.79]KAF2011467.1 hypothetical protein BU24DRAFT_281627 [Aaosphaeria arxii CBS 175.79]